MSWVGRTIGQYQVVSELGRGQNAIAYKAWQPSLHRYVTLKVLHQNDEETRQRFQREAHLTAQFIQQGVPNLRQVYEVDQTSDGHLFVALEYVDDSLQNIIQRGKERQRCMNPTRAARLLEPVAGALDAIHSLGWIHLDVKPQNILIFRSGRAVLADLGIAQRRGTRTHACTPAYASPEQATGDAPVGPWSDIYSLGVVLYEMVTGRLPVQGDCDIVLLNQHAHEMPPPPRQFNSQLTLNQEQAILRALAKSPQDRHRTAVDLIQAMVRPENFISSIILMPGAMLHTTSWWARRMPRRALIGGVLALVFIILFLITWAVWPRLLSVTPATGPSTATELGVEQTIVSPVSSSPSLTATSARSPTATIPPRPTVAPTVTLAPTFTRTPRPTATPTRRPTPEPTASWSPTP